MEGYEKQDVREGGGEDGGGVERSSLMSGRLSGAPRWMVSVQRIDGRREARMFAMLMWEWNE